MAMVVSAGEDGRELKEEGAGVSVASENLGNQSKTTDDSGLGTSPREEPLEAASD